MLKLEKWGFLTALVLVITLTGAAIRAPPWADPELNPCANQPRGWQYIFWPEDGQCYKIFQIGYPCPETMELVPTGTRKPRSLRAECRCPPTSALHNPSGQCYELFKIGPCEKGQYFAPQKETQQSLKMRQGTCKKLERCPNPNDVFWPLEEKCYKKHTKGPCSRGQLLTLTKEHQIPVCSCFNENDNELEKFYWPPSNSCYEHYTKGPCQEKGHLFLPGRVCNCHNNMTHFHEDTEQCYELDTPGPCRRGHIFTQTANSTTATCNCKSDHLTWLEDGNCYRPFTQGPCPSTQIILNSTTCIPIPCSKGYLYFPEQKTCYRIGSQGPCSTGQIVTFDFRTRPSVDGISHNGICGCKGLFNEHTNCLKEKRSAKVCENGLVQYKSKCYKLYNKGPCPDGQWLVPSKDSRLLWQDGTKNLVKCDCRPGYSVVSSDKGNIKCLPPTVSLANYLNKYFIKA